MMTKTELDTLCRLAEAAGREVMAVYRDGGEIWQKGDQSPLTEADLRADKKDTHFSWVLDFKLNQLPDLAAHAQAAIKKSSCIRHGVLRTRVASAGNAALPSSWA